MPTHKELLIASRQFAQERVWLSWWHIGSTLAIALALVAIVCSELHLAGRVLASTVLGLVLVRLFVLYHDFQHGAILRGSRLGRVLMETVGLILLTPPSSWNR